MSRKMKTINLLKTECMELLTDAGYDEDEIEIFNIENIKDIIFLLGEGATKEKIVI